MQIVSDISQTPQVVPAQTVGAGYGDAFLAGLATGLVQRSDLAAWVGETRTVAPNPDLAGRYDALFRAYKDLYTATRGLVHRLQTFVAGW